MTLKQLKQGYTQTLRGKYSRKIELKSPKSQKYLRKVFKRYLEILYSFLNALLMSCICHAATLSILFWQDTDRHVLFRKLQ